MSESVMDNMNMGNTCFLNPEKCQKDSYFDLHIIWELLDLQENSQGLTKSLPSLWHSWPFLPQLPCCGCWWHEGILPLKGDGVVRGSTSCPSSQHSLLRVLEGWCFCILDLNLLVCCTKVKITLVCEVELLKKKKLLRKDICLMQCISECTERGRQAMPKKHCRQLSIP